jgi:hypothetical protein
MPAPVFPPESFGPWAIAGAKFTAVSKATVARASSSVSFQYSVINSAKSGIAVVSRVGRLTATTLLSKFRNSALDAKT